MIILEQYTHGKHGDPARNEDGLYAGHAYVAVVDGVTSKSSANIWKPTPGVVARDITLRAIADADADLDMRGMQQQIDRALRAQYSQPTTISPEHTTSSLQTMSSHGTMPSRETMSSEQTTPSQQTTPASSMVASRPLTEEYFRTHPNDRLQINAVIYSSHAHEIWLFGDCQAMVNGQVIPTLKRVDALLGELRSFAWQALALQHSCNAHGDEHITQQLSQQQTKNHIAHNQLPADSLKGQLHGAEPAYDHEPPHDSSQSHNTKPSPEPSLRIHSQSHDSSQSHNTEPLRDSESPRDPEPPHDDSDPARAMILPFLQLQSHFANTRGDYGYFVFDGFTDPEYPIRTIPVSSGDDIVLASDGYPQLRPTLTESEAALADLRERDPHLIRDFITTKGFTPGLDSFDDRTFLHFIA